MTAGATDPRYPSLKGIMAAKSKPVDTVSAGDLGVTDLAATQTVAAVTDAPGEGGRRDRDAATRRSCGSPTSWPTRR